MATKTIGLLLHRGNTWVSDMEVCTSMAVEGDVSGVFDYF